MKLRLTSTLFVLTGFFVGVPTLATAQGAEPAVKKSESGICHDKTSSSFGVTKKFEAFPNLEACLKSGGRAPANAAAPEVVVVKKSDSGICHDKSSPSFEKTQKFTAFKSVEECVKSGGTLPKK